MRSTPRPAPHPRRLPALRRRRHGCGSSPRQLRRHDGRHGAGRAAARLSRRALGVGRAGRLRRRRRRRSRPSAGGRGGHGGPRIGVRVARVLRPPVPGAGRPADAGRRGAGARRNHRRLGPDRGVLPDGPGQPRSRDGARRLPAGATGATRTRVVLLRGPRLQAYARSVGLAGGEAAALASLADARHRSARARRGAQAPRHLVLHVPDPPLEQDHALSARMEGRVPEQFWRLAPPPAGWEGLADFI